jgi:hypothetical protein
VATDILRALVRVEVGDAQLRKLVARVAEVLVRLIVEGVEPTRLVGHDDARRSEREERAVQGLALAQRVLGPPPLRDVDERPHGSRRPPLGVEERRGLWA